jgi:hypothetical protein
MVFKRLARVLGRAGKKWRGSRGGNFLSASRSPAARAYSRGAEQKNLLFLLEEKSVARKIRNAKKVFLRGRPPLCGGAEVMLSLVIFRNF